MRTSSVGGDPDMSRILLIKPYSFLSSQYSERRGFAIYAKKTIAYWSDGACQSAEIGYPDAIPASIDLDKIRAKIAWYAPLWSRWMGRADRYEDYRQSCLLFVIRFVQVLQELDVKSVVFFTGVAHHIEYSLIEAACQMAGAQQIYLYPMPFFTVQSRLLPLVQNDSIRDRRILGAEVSRKGARDEILAYRGNHLAGRPPLLNEKIDRVATSYLFALIQVPVWALKSVIRRLLRKGFYTERHPIDARQDYDFLSMLGLIRQQKKALDYYLSSMLDESQVDQLVEMEGPLPILYAHYQPEATTFPEGGDYTNHLDLVIAIRRLGYRGKVLYKEHPGSWIFYSRVVGFSRVGLCRSIEYYKRLAALGCVFVPPSFELKGSCIDKLFPVTITGSICLERSLAGLATCCAGLPWFKGAPGVYDLAETFGQGGIFFDGSHWQFDPIFGVEWFERALSRKTINNYPGIGTGRVSDSDTDMADFLNEMEALMRALDMEGVGV